MGYLFFSEQKQNVKAPRKSIMSLQSQKLKDASSEGQPDDTRRGARVLTVMIQPEDMMYVRN